MVRCNSDDPLCAGLTGRRTVFQWHGDTFELPTGAVQLARSELCEQQAFRYGAKAYGLQFHIEVTEAMVTRWLEEPGNRAELRDLDYIDAESIRCRLPTMIREMEAWGQHVLARFATICRDHCA